MYIEMSATFRIAKDMMPAKIENSIAEVPRRSRPSALTPPPSRRTWRFVVARASDGDIFASSIDQLAAAGNACGRHRQPGRLASAGLGDVARTIDGDVIHDHDKAGLAVAGLVDRAADRHARMRQIDQPGDVPCRSVAGRRNVDAGGQIRILIDCNAGPGS